MPFLKFKYWGMCMSRRTLANAFQPATEVEDPHRFAGREEQIKLLADALHVIGSVPLVFGQRGLGKSSLALQVSRIAQGDVELLAQLDLEHLALEADQRFIAFYLTCTDSTADFNGLLQLMINAVESLEFEAVNDGAGKVVSLVDKTTRKKLALKMFEHETTRQYRAEVGRLPYQDLGLEEKLSHLCDLLTRFYGQPVLFVIDELDRVAKTKGLASFLKAYSSADLKFVLVGIASNQSELLADHASLSRRLYSVMVPLMDRGELEDIVTRTEDYLQGQDEFFTFSDRAKMTLASIASGFPWFVHVIGQQALLGAADSGKTTVETMDVKKAVAGLLQNTFAQQFADLYQAAVRDSHQREIVLRLFACWNGADIPTSVIYPLARKLTVTNPATYRGHLTSEAYGNILFAPVFQERGLLRFRDEMFKVYVRLQSGLYTGVKESVNEAFKNR